QEFFFVAGLLVMAGIGLFLVTSTVGRAWCGYTCPQTVWVDLFLWVERAVEGDRNARIKLDAASWTGGKIYKRFLKHTIWIVIAIATGGAWIFYFADGPTLFRDLFTGNAAYVAYATVAVLTATTYIFGGLMREQVCTYMCPWPRIQAAMLDEDSLTVTYNDWRGEPRSGHRKKMQAAGTSVGDCVDCNACVAVCPMGIDIRDGQQLECITCALCIDACDSVMQKIGLEKGLISYATLKTYNENMMRAGASVIPGPTQRFANASIEPGRVRDENRKLLKEYAETTWRSIIRPRTIIYSFFWAGIGLAMLIALLMRDRLDINVIHDRNPVFVMLSDGSIRNGYQLKIRNMIPQPRRFTVTLEGLPKASMKLAGSNSEPTDEVIIDVKPDQLHAAKVFVRVPADAVQSQHQTFQFVVTEIDGEEKAVYTAKFEAPERAQ
ncbi:MAG: cytochrome c oxidase accessory protein CcoG, partial [Hyphomicrobiaceae bacterium]